MANIGLIFGILLIIGFSIVTVSASEDPFWVTPTSPASEDPFWVTPTSPTNDNPSWAWLTPGSVEDIMAWFKATSKNAWTVPTVPADSSGTFPITTPTYVPSDNTAWLIPDTPEQIIAYGKMIAKQAATTTHPSALSQADRIRLFRSYNTNGYVPINPTVTGTSLPMTPTVYPTGYPIIYYKPITIPATPHYIPSTMPTAFPTQAPITIPPTRYYIPSTMPTAYPTISPTVVPGQSTGVSLPELNLPGKYVRITNSGSTPVVMTGWKITNSQGNSLNFIDFPLGGGTTFTYVLNPYSTITVYFGREGMVSASELYYPYGTDFWNQNGDTASLYNPQGQLVGRISA